MAPLMFFMNGPAFLMARLMFFTRELAVSMVLMASVTSEPGAVATGFFHLPANDRLKNPVATAPGSNLSGNGDRAETRP
jgi:hypothetical protein